MFTALFWKRTAERAVRAFAAALVALITATSFNIYNWNGWTDAVATSLVAALASVLMSVAATNVGDREDPAFLKEGAK